MTTPFYDTSQVPAYTAGGGGGGGITPPAGDIGGSTGTPTVVSTHLSAPLPVAQGGTGAATAGAWPTLNQSTTGNAATAANLAGGATFPAYVAPAVSALTFGSSVAVNAALANAFNLTLTASTATLANPSNPVDGQVIRVRVTQGGAGGFTLAYGTAYDFGASGAPVLSTAAGKVDLLAFEYIGSLGKWVYLGSVLGN